MSREMDRASDLETIEREAAIRRQLAAARVPMSPKLCAHCEENPRRTASQYCERCESEVTA